MNKVRSYINGMSLLLLLASLLMSGLFYLQWYSDVIPNDQQPEASAESAAIDLKISSTPRFEPTPIQSLSEITERPLFTEGRIPPEKPAEPKQARVPETPLNLKLEGVAITPRSKVAIITDLQSNTLLRLSQGMSHGNWKVKEVSEGSVTIQRGSREIILTLKIDETKAGGARPKVPFRMPTLRRPSSH
jgi:type II secretory pathway component PulC